MPRHFPSPAAKIPPTGSTAADGFRLPPTACRVLAASALAFALALAGGGCEEGFHDEGNISDDALNGRIAAAAETGTADAAAAGSSSGTTVRTAQADDSGGNGSGGGANSSATGGESPDPVNTSSAIGAIAWKGKNVSSWPITTTLRASVSGGTVRLNYDKKNSWPVVDGVCANCWAIVNIGGTWYAGTFEYLRPGQDSKPTSTLDGSGGDHFKTSPLSSWRPRSGEVFGLMVSGLCRGGLSNVQERSNICIVRWP